MPRFLRAPAARHFRPVIQPRSIRIVAKKSPAPKSEAEALMENAHDASELLKALSHEARLAILCLLAEGEKSVTEIEHALKLRQPAISQHLARLRVDGLVDARRNGKSIYYSLGRPEVREVIRALHRAFCAPDAK